MRTTFNINFVCRQSKVTKTGKAPVEMSIILNGKRTYLALPYKEDPKLFSKLMSSNDWTMEQVMQLEIIID